jgi:CheY-like chemotaxis protein
MSVIRLVHWNEKEAAQRASRLTDAGYEIEYDMPIGPELLRALGQKPPAAVVIDLSRLPSQGRDVALAIRRAKSTRNVPIVFVEGDLQKLARIRVLLPDAVYTSWDGIRSDLEAAIAHPPANPVVPKSSLEGYSGTPLAKKLGIKENTSVALIGAPEDFRDTLGDLPAGVHLCSDLRGHCDVTIWFTRSAEELRKGMPRMTARAATAPLWIAWPKKASGIDTDLSERLVRANGLAAGLVDYKICAIDATWSGLLFTRRRP